MEVVNFIFGVHNHQPVGNFPWVFEEVYQKAYLPFLEVLSRHPKIKVSLHVSGSLWDWIQENHTEYLELLKYLHARKQIEFISGGYYEPILPLIPEWDRSGQIDLLCEYLENQFGEHPRGMWVAERVWEPSMAGTINEAGLEYTVLDDWHFKSSGLTDDELYGYYLTEDGGKVVKVFSGNRDLRYLVPFHSVEEIIKFFKSIGNEGKLLCLADDGEKFGGWPGTHQHCYTNGWLEEFLAALEANTWISCITFSEYIDRFPPLGRVYLPTTSYQEMMEWTLPAKLQEKYSDFVKKVQEEQSSSILSFVRGGFFRNFLSKYEEANHMHKRMLRVSSRVRECRVSSSDWERAQIELWKGQCNCAYWHGIFGGLYLPHLRNAVYQHLIEAEKILDKMERSNPLFTYDIVDFDCCGKDEIIIETSVYAMYFSPSHGGTLIEFDYKPKNKNLIDVLSSKMEGYHMNISLADIENIEFKRSDVRSIHEIEDYKEKNLWKDICYDEYRRASFRDHFFSEETNIEHVRKESGWDLGDFAIASYLPKISMKGNSILLSLQKEGHISQNNSLFSIRVKKDIKINEERNDIEIRYSIENLGEKEVRVKFGIEFCFSLRGFLSDGMNENDLTDIIERRFKDILSIVDESRSFQIIFNVSRETGVWCFPIKTISKSERGFENIYQGCVFMPFWELELKPKLPCLINIVQEIQEIKGNGM